MGRSFDHIRVVDTFAVSKIQSGTLKVFGAGTIPTMETIEDLDEGRAMDRRDEFLVEMYKQMFNDINRHIMVVWQSVGVLVGAFAIFALVEKNVISTEIATSIIVLLCAWLYAHLVDAGYWYNRNLAIIANIERQFLTTVDQQLIHYYFGTHRPDNKMITHLRIQQALGIGLSALVLVYHFITRVWPGLSLSFTHFDPLRALPYVMGVAAIIYGNYIRDDRNRAYAEFLENSPGVKVDNQGIKYGTGHGFGKTTGG
jgi:hypothetical protein